MATLEEFLKTGQLGPLSLGMSPFDVATVLGDPEDQSRKMNPLVLRYGCVNLTFLRDSVHPKPKLKEIVVAYHGSAVSLPDAVRFTDWEPTRRTSASEFRSFLERIAYPPAHNVEGLSESHLILLSGAKITFSGGVLHDVRFAQRTTPDREFIPLSDEREPTLDQITDLLQEAERALEAKAGRAGLVIAWAALEATLRRLALNSGLQSRIGAQPISLIRELHATRIITPIQFPIIERLRRIRSDVAHGVMAIPVHPMMVQELIDITTSLLREAATEHP